MVGLRPVQAEAAPISRRILAAVIDTGMQVVLLFVFAAIFADLQFSERAIIAGLLLISATYSIGFLGMTSSTPGKMAMGLWVSDPAGQRVMPDRAILRYLILALPNLTIVYVYAWFVVTPLLIAVNLALLLTDKKRRLLHDRIAGTQVIVGRPPELPEYY